MFLYCNDINIIIMKSMTTITSNVRTVKFIMSLLLTVSGFCVLSCGKVDLMSDNLNERDRLRL